MTILCQILSLVVQRPAQTANHSRFFVPLILLLVDSSAEQYVMQSSLIFFPGVDTRELPIKLDSNFTQ